MAPLTINPPLLNSANPWCTTLEQLQELYNDPHTGAITTRTSLLNGFPHDPSTHQFTFYNPSNHSASEPNLDQGGTPSQTGSLNTLGYSPLPLSTYLDYAQQISDAHLKSNKDKTHPTKPIILSVTGTAEEVTHAYRLITTHQPTTPIPLAMEINLSCPNIPNAPPPAYDPAALLTYLHALKAETTTTNPENNIPIGIKTPPYTHTRPNSKPS